MCGGCAVGGRTAAAHLLPTTERALHCNNARLAARRGTASLPTSRASSPSRVTAKGRTHAGARIKVMRCAGAGPVVPYSWRGRQAFDAGIGANLDLNGAGVSPTVRRFACGVFSMHTNATASTVALSGMRHCNSTVQPRRALRGICVLILTQRGRHRVGRHLLPQQPCAHPTRTRTRARTRASQFLCSSILACPLLHARLVCTVRWRQPADAATHHRGGAPAPAAEARVQAEARVPNLQHRARAARGLLPAL